MKFYKEKIMNMYPDSGKIALFISLLALGLMVGNNNQPCLSAQSTCSVGSDNEFTENIKIKGGTSYATTLDGSGILADRTLTLPDSDLDLNNVIVAGGLSSTKSVSTDGSGDLTTNDVYPLTLSVSKSLSTSATGELETNDIYPLTLTASTPLKTNVSGEVTASDLVPETDLTVGSGIAGQVLAVNVGATALEFIDAGGGAHTLIDSGTIIPKSSGSDEVFICWYGNTLDATKKYKLIFDGGTGFNIGANGYIPSFLLLDGDCTAGKNEWESSSYYRTAVTTTGEIDNSFYRNTWDRCVLLNSGNANTSNLRSSNITGDITFTAVDNGNDYGFSSQHQTSGVVTDSAGNVQGTGQQQGYGSCSVWDKNYLNPFSDITGFMFYFEGGFPAPLTRKWSLYEIDF